MIYTRFAFALTMAMGGVVLSANTAQAACGATVNGRPMSVQLCNLGRQVYGRVLPGTYSMDSKGNWYHHETRARGNTFADARRASGGNCVKSSVFAQGYGGSCNGPRRSIFGPGN